MKIYQCILIYVIQSYVLRTEIIIWPQNMNSYEKYNLNHIGASKYGQSTDVGM